MRRPSLEAIGDLSGLSTIDIERLSVADVERIGRVYMHFAACLVSWNLEEEVLDEHGEPTGEVRPIPATPAGIGMVEDYTVLGIVHVWLQVLNGDGIIKADIPQEALTPQDTPAGIGG